MAEIYGVAKADIISVILETIVGPVWKRGRRDGSKDSGFHTTGVDVMQIVYNVNDLNLWSYFTWQSPGDFMVELIFGKILKISHLGYYSGIRAGDLANLRVYFPNYQKSQIQGFYYSSILEEYWWFIILRHYWRTQSNSCVFCWFQGSLAYDSYRWT